MWLSIDCVSEEGYNICDFPIFISIKVLKVGLISSANKAGLSENNFFRNYACCNCISLLLYVLCMLGMYANRFANNLHDEIQHRPTRRPKMIRKLGL